jgi:hypothetical protein
MTTDSAYEDNLRHVAEPQAPSEREKAPSSSLQDYEALWLADVLREHAHYGDHNHDTEPDIAVAYASFIDQKIRAEGKKHVNLYAHTDVAVETLVSAILQYRANNADDESFPMALYTGIERQFADAFIERADGADHGEPMVIEIDGEDTVVYDEQEAKESYAEMVMAEAESQAMARIEEDANARGIDNRKTPSVNPRFCGDR